MLWLVLIGVVLGLAAVAVGGHLILTWAERRGWVYYRTKDRPRPQSLGLLEEIYQPSITHVIDEQVTEQTEADQAEAGEEAEKDGFAAPRPFHGSPRSTIWHRGQKL